MPSGVLQRRARPSFISLKRKAYLPKRAMTLGVVSE
jgi:hypothetical protein